MGLLSRAGEIIKAKFNALLIEKLKYTIARTTPTLRPHPYRVAIVKDAKTVMIAASGTSTIR